MLIAQRTTKPCLFVMRYQKVLLGFLLALLAVIVFSLIDLHAHYREHSAVSLFDTITLFAAPIFAVVCAITCYTTTFYVYTYTAQLYEKDEETGNYHYIGLNSLRQDYFALNQPALQSLGIEVLEYVIHVLKTTKSFSENEEHNLQKRYKIMRRLLREQTRIEVASRADTFSYASDLHSVDAYFEGQRELLSDPVQ